MADETDWETEGAAGPVLPRPSGSLLRTPPNFRGFPEREPPLIDRAIEKRRRHKISQIREWILHSNQRSTSQWHRRMKRIARRSRQASAMPSDEIRNGFIDMMKLMNDLYRPQAGGSRSEASAVTRPEERGSAQNTGAVPKRPVVQPQALRPPSVLPRRPPPSQEPDYDSLGDIHPLSIALKFRLPSTAETATASSLESSGFSVLLEAHFAKVNPAESNISTNCLSIKSNSSKESAPVSKSFT
ncbi:hypothetical protein ACLKA6_004532 [Drosophila palustris]